MPGQATKQAGAAGSEPAGIAQQSGLSRSAAPGTAGTATLDLSPDVAAWDAFVSRSNPGSYLQTSAWAQVKAPNGWTPLRFMGTTPVASTVFAGSDAELRSADERAPDDEDTAGKPHEITFGAQVLLRRPRIFPWTFAYAPRGPVLGEWSPPAFTAFTAGLRDAVAAAASRISHVRIEPEIELDGPCDADGELRHALRENGWRPGATIQPPRTRQIDLQADEAALWGGLRKKWRQYVNKARKSGLRVVDAPVDRLPEFYSIYQETARRAGFVIRTYESYLGVWDAFARLGMVRLLMAETADGKGLATLFLLRVGNRVIEPYGGMTAEGAESRANYLLKWEAIRTSREQGAVSYDMWGLSHEGIEHFKTGFGGREIRYVGAWDLVLDPAGRLAYDSAQVWQDRVARLKHGIRHQRGGREDAEGHHEPEAETAE
jgi:lipid II:glycine glycyltransferase (peptidoglycan interpeptide bridge formation enzyme)